MRVCLDLDGTLITCRNRQMALLRAVLPARFKIDTSEVWRRKRSGQNSLEALVAAGVPRPDATRAFERWMQQIEDPAWLRLDAVLDTVHEGLQQLQHRDDELHLLTARQNAFWVDIQLRNLNLAAYFQSVHIVSPQGASQSKAVLLNRLRADVFVGDTESDGHAASGAQVRFAALSTGQRNAGFLRHCGYRPFESFANAVNQL